MLAYSDTKIQEVALHFVGNSFHEEGLTLGNTKLEFTQEVEEHLLTYFFSSFKENEFYRFHHESHLNLNELFSIIFIECCYTGSNNFFVTKNYACHQQNDNRVQQRDLP